jgi:uncharacterized protein
VAWAFSLRRRWRYILAIAGSVALALGLRAFWLEPSSLIVVEQHLDIPWPAQRPLRIAVLTDLHVGSPFNGLEKLRAAVHTPTRPGPTSSAFSGTSSFRGSPVDASSRPRRSAAELASLRAPATLLTVGGPPAAVK